MTRSLDEAGGVGAPAIRVAVAYACADRQYLVELELATGATVADALAAVRGQQPFADLELATMPKGIFGERVDADRVLVDHDRVELYRPLLLDPLEARRRR